MGFTKKNKGQREPEEGFPPNSPSSPSAVGKEAEKVGWACGGRGTSEAPSSWAFITRLTVHAILTVTNFPVCLRSLQSLSPAGRQEMDINRKWKSP